jgi:hypothetical protein
MTDNECIQVITNRLSQIEDTLNSLCKPQVRNEHLFKERDLLLLYLKLIVNNRLYGK